MRPLVATLFVAVLLAPPFAHAQRAPTAGEVALARTQFEEGVRHAQSNEWDAALAAFQRSYELAPRPITLMNLAGAQAETHHYVAAMESYRRYLATAGERDVARYRTQVESALQEAESKVARVTLRATGLLDGDRLTLDGDELPHAVVGMAMPVDPGDHHYVVERGGASVATRGFHSIETAEVEVSLSVPAPSPEDVARAGAGGGEQGNAAIIDAGPHRATHDDGGILASPWFWVVTGVLVVGAAVAVGVVVATSGSVMPFDGNTMPGSILVP